MGGAHAIAGEGGHEAGSASSASSTAAICSCVALGPTEERARGAETGLGRGGDAVHSSPKSRPAQLPMHMLPHCAGATAAPIPWTSICGGHRLRQPPSF